MKEPLLLADCLRSKPNLSIYQSFLTIVLVFLVVKLRSVFIIYLTAFEDVKLPISLIGVTVIGRIRIPAYTIDQMNFTAEGWS